MEPKGPFSTSVGGALTVAEKAPFKRIPYETPKTLPVSEPKKLRKGTLRLYGIILTFIAAYMTTGICHNGEDTPLRRGCPWMQYTKRTPVFSEGHRRPLSKQQ
jgi:hypothetical protein